MYSVREQQEAQRIARENEPILPARRESDLTVKSATSSVREQSERQQALQRDNAKPKLDPWTRGIVDRVRAAQANQPMSYNDLRGIAEESAAELEREAKQREAAAKAEREQREAREKAEAELQRKRKLQAWKDSQRDAALEGLTPNEKYSVVNRAMEMGAFDDPGTLEILVKEAILNRPENAEQRYAEQLVVQDGMRYKSAKNLARLIPKTDIARLISKAQAMTPTTGFEKGKQ